MTGNEHNVLLKSRVSLGHGNSCTSCIFDAPWSSVRAQANVKCWNWRSPESAYMPWSGLLQRNNERISTCNYIHVTGYMSTSRHRTGYVDSTSTLDCIISLCVNEPFWHFKFIENLPILNILETKQLIQRVSRPWLALSCHSRKWGLLSMSEIAESITRTRRWYCFGLLIEDSKSDIYSWTDTLTISSVS